MHARPSVTMSECTYDRTPKRKAKRNNACQHDERRRATKINRSLPAARIFWQIRRTPPHEGSLSYYYMITMWFQTDRPCIDPLILSNTFRKSTLNTCIWLLPWWQSLPPHRQSIAINWCHWLLGFSEVVTRHPTPPSCHKLSITVCLRINSNARPTNKAVKCCWYPTIWHDIHDEFFRPVAGYVAFFRPNLGRKTKYASEKPGKAQNAFIWLLLMVFEC